MVSKFPRIVVAGLSGGTGKTIVSLGLARAWTRGGRIVQPFKKGPDYIDANWLGLASGRPCTNLDPYFLDAERIRSLFQHRAACAQLNLVEGNRGLFDGMDESGSCSTAELARQLDAPVVLAVDCTKMTRTIAAIVQGCVSLEPGLRLAGVICNRTAGERHRSILRRSIETHTDVPVLGMLPKLKANPIPERHMGLVSDQEYEAGHYEGQAHALDAVADMAEEWLDIDALTSIAEQVPEMATASPLWAEPAREKTVRIGYVHDQALWFYYRENLEALEHAGAELVRLSLLDEKPWPELHGLYLGGGFPETFAPQLAANGARREKVAAMCRSGMPVYAECGGFMYLCRELEFEGDMYPMAGVFPVSTTFCPKPQGLGYTTAVVEQDNLFHPTGESYRGHEFHYSRCVRNNAESMDFAVRMERGAGMHGCMDGAVFRNTFAGYNHVHALAVPWWAPAFVRAAERFRAGGGC
ncbi:cobyrinate a,c-diamide synthase [Pseudodesulfovibrio senegalensis]|uniref:Cobyrinate a,c-diamide synthase n=1 Tax=Pseudodesulfovibrio senegalensis TaxID=1721087 RepID=A0A6N6N1Y2_9BACT|nr:cobyrinate a,c-diamide synthase [Pseudodesulfovibrio senegalensis]KAB1441550.1 cobyrinate a,c-diamide synthase [Pseudodesulfovibrio senegalensis]